MPTSVIRVVKGCSRHVREFWFHWEGEEINSYDPSSSVQPLCCYGEFFIVTLLVGTASNTTWSQDSLRTFGYVG